MRRFMSFTVGAIIGGMVVSILVLLYTPFSGEVARSRISDYSKNAVSDLKKAAETRRLELLEELERLKS